MNTVKFLGFVGIFCNRLTPETEVEKFGFRLQQTAMCKDLLHEQSLNEQAL